MSVKVSGKVWDSSLPPNKKLVALCYADHADHNGKNVYPLVETVAELTGYSDRTIRRITKSLKKMGILVPDGQGPGSRPDRRSNRYFFNVKALPKRGDKMAGRSQNGVTNEQNGVTNDAERGDMGVTQIRHRSVSDPSDPAGKAGKGDLEGSENGESDHQRLMRLYQDALGYGIPHGAKEGKGAKKILQAGHSPEEAIACYNWLKARDFWQNKHLSLQSVHEQIGPWKAIGQPSPNGHVASMTVEEVEAANKSAMEKAERIFGKKL